MNTDRNLLGINTYMIRVEILTYDFFVRTTSVVTKILPPSCDVKLNSRTNAITMPNYEVNIVSRMQPLSILIPRSISLHAAMQLLWQASLIARVIGLTFQTLCKTLMPFT